MYDTYHCTLRRNQRNLAGLIYTLLSFGFYEDHCHFLYLQKCVNLLKSCLLGLFFMCSSIDKISLSTKYSISKHKLNLLPLKKNEIVCWLIVTVMNKVLFVLINPIGMKNVNSRLKSKSKVKKILIHTEARLGAVAKMLHG